MQSIKISEQIVNFMRVDGTLATNSVAMAGVDEKGEAIFFELIDHVKPVLQGKRKYERLVIRRVFPVIDVISDSDAVVEEAEQIEDYTQKRR